MVENEVVASVQYKQVEWEQASRMEWGLLKVHADAVARETSSFAECASELPQPNRCT